MRAEALQPLPAEARTPAAAGLPGLQWPRGMPTPLGRGGAAGAVEMRHWQAMERWPILKEVFPAKEAKRVRRAPGRAPPAGGARVVEGGRAGYDAGVGARPAAGRSYSPPACSPSAVDSFR